jgi:hypothetical protein
MSGNDKLILSLDWISRSGIGRDEFPGAIAELEALGFIDVVGLDDSGMPNRVRVSDDGKISGRKKRPSGARREPNGAALECRKRHERPRW